MVYRHAPVKKESIQAVYFVSEVLGRMSFSSVLWVILLDVDVDGRDPRWH